MKIFKIVATISHCTSGDAYNMYGEDRVTSYKEFYHKSEANAISHIYAYINECVDNGIVLFEQTSKKKLGDNYKKWVNEYGDRGHYEITLNPINVWE